MVHKFEKLRVWNESIQFIELIYALCKKLPYEEERNLKDQIRRASTSISLNIAEGSAAETDVDFKRFLFVSKKSQIECIAILRLINNFYHINIDVESEKAEVIGKMLHGLVKYLKEPKNSS